ncbi:MAG TPA: 1,4-alpha-glucan branching protein domain-containing protein [Mycobacteriales bacterium]
MSRGTCCIVLHTHLPWLPHHGSWPVGEEWLYQAWSGAYLPLAQLLGRLADEGRTDQLTVGLTPVLASMLDDAYCLDAMHTWLGTWQVRAEGAAVRGVATAAYEGTLAAQALRVFERDWAAGASPLLRRLVESGVVELLGGPAAHAFTPFVPAAVADFGLRAGLDDTEMRLGRRPEGIWAPECAYTPGLEDLYARRGVRRFLVDGPTVHGDTGAPVDVAGSGVIAFARDLEVTYRVWSPRRGYPGGPAYRDFHTFDHDSGLRAARVTSRHTEPEHKRPYRPERAAEALRRDVDDFVAHVVRRLDTLPQDDPLVVCAYDTELFGHWWHEGPRFLDGVLRALPEAGVRVTTLRRAAETMRAEPRDLPAGSWGMGKDFHVWQVPELQATQDDVAERLLRLCAKRIDRIPHDAAYDQLAREALLALASDWPFCVTHQSAADYARDRLSGHARAFAAIADPLEAGDPARALRAARLSYRRDYPFPRLDARQVPVGG